MRILKFFFRRMKYLEIDITSVRVINLFTAILTTRPPPEISDGKQFNYTND
jgi:hypothetical protein